MMNFGSLVVAAASTAKSTSSTTAAAGTGALLISFLPFVAIIAVFYFLMIRPQHKKEKKTQQMREALQVGDNLTTVGGIIGRVVSVKEDSVVIETGAERNKLLIKKWAIQSVETIHDTIA